LGALDAAGYSVIGPVAPAIADATGAGPATIGPLVFASAFLTVAGVSLAGIVADVPLWLPAVVLAGVGIGLANTGSLGLLVEAVPVERIVTAMVIWSQLGIVGYLLGPLAGGLVADGPGYAFVGLVPALAGLGILVLLRADGPATRPSRRSARA
jgi:hypothetical protein